MQPLPDAIQTNHEDQQESTQQLSKNQLKKQMRNQRWLDARGERRKLEREKRKTKRRAQAEANKASDVPRQTFKLMADSQNKFRVVIDMDFENFMTDNEIGKAVQQVGRIYSANRHSDNPCQLYVSSLKGKIRDRFGITNTGYHNWDINCSESDYVELFDTKQDANKFVYLSGDATDNLPDTEELLKDSSKIFVIGGLVDHNRHKNLCKERAIKRNIPIARLPIRENVTLCQRHILSTVTVFEIMLQVLGSHKSWADALLASIPKRKIAPPVTLTSTTMAGQEIKQTDCDTKEGEESTLESC